MSQVFRRYPRISTFVSAGLAAMLFAAGPVQAGQAPAAYTTATRYNLAGQVTGVIKPAANHGGVVSHPAVRNTYNGRGLLERFEEGVLTSWKDENALPADWGPSFQVARQTVYTYDELGRIATESALTSSGNAVGLIQYTYDDFNRVECKAVRMNPAVYGSLPSDACALSTEGQDGPDRITHFEYNALGQIKREKRAYRTELEQDHVTYEYVDNRLSDEIDANGNRTHLTYDSLGRLEYMYFPSKTTPGTHSSTDYEKYGYDNNGNRTSLRKRDERVIGYFYDALNRVWLEDLPGTTSEDVYSKHDLLGNRVYARFGSADGLGVTSTINGFGELVAETSDVSGTSYTLSYQYDRNSNRTQVKHPDGTVFTYQYDGLDRLNAIYEGAAAGMPLLQPSFDALARPRFATTAGGAISSVSYDQASRIQTVGLTPLDSAYVVSQTFGYNAAAQVNSRQLSNDNYEFSEKGSKAGEYRVNGLNQYTSVGGLAYQHDNNGNLTSNGSATFGYDVQNRLTSSNLRGGVSLVYDPLGRLSRITVGSQSTDFLYSGDQLVGEYQNGVLVNRYVFSEAGDHPAVSYAGAVVSSGNRLFLHVDRQGSVIAATNSAGMTVYVNTYDAYGVPGALNIGRFAYTGQTYLPELGMYYYKARIYSPQLGRFLQTDPVGYKDDLNLYTYVGNDPLNRTDPDGQMAKLVTTIVKVVAKGGDIASTVSGIVENAAIILSPTASLGQKAFAALDIAADVVTGVNSKDVKAGLAIVDKIGDVAKDVEKAAHGNKIDDRLATLYEKYDKNGNFLKHGVTKHEDPTKRYTAKKIDGGTVVRTDRGPRSEMIKKERDLVERKPGPENKEPWAGKRKGQ